MYARLKNVSSLGYQECSLAPTQHVAQQRIKQLLFFLEFFVNDGAYLIYEGNSYPGWCAKNSLLEWEYGTLDIRHKDRVVVNDAGHVRKRKQDLTHDRLLYNGCDRQQHLLANDQIDEFDFLSVALSGWCVKPDPNGSLMIGGLRSPCMNACYEGDHLDRTGQVLTSFDGVFEFEREKELFYLECYIHSLKETFNNNNNNKGHKDLPKECRISKMIAYVHLALDKYGLANSIPRSTVRVDEDHWYMRGGNCVVDDPDGKWPCTSIFLYFYLYFYISHQGSKIPKVKFYLKPNHTWCA